MNVTSPGKQYPRRACRPVVCVWLICLIPAGGFAQQASPPDSDAPAQPLPQPAQPLPQSVLSSIGRMSIGIARDQAGILARPTRIRKKDLTWLVPLAAVTVTAFAFDRPALNEVSINPARVDTYRTISNFTGIYTPLAAVGASWIAGAIKHDDHLKETGFLAGEALADTFLFTTMVKYAANRVRPGATGLTGSSGEFWPNGQYFAGGDSFPSGHTAAAFAFAHIVADEYPSWKVKLAVYGLAAATALERVGGREHFPSDVTGGRRDGLSGRRLRFSSPPCRFFPKPSYDQPDGRERRRRFGGFLQIARRERAPGHADTTP